MAIQTRKIGARWHRITPQDDGALLELGPAGTTQQVSTFVIQFTPNLTWSGSVAVLARTLGTPADAVDVPFVAVPYRLISKDDVAQDYSFQNAIITGNTLIQVPCNGLTLVLLAQCASGSLDVTSYDLQGPSAV